MNEPVIFFDGYCNLCSASVQFIIERDRRSRFKYAALQSDFAKNMLGEEFADQYSNQGSVLVLNGKVYTKSSAALQIARRLDGWWPLLFGFYIIPKFLRDFFYGIIAKYRYKWWGRKEQCWVATPDISARFLG